MVTGEEDADASDPTTFDDVDLDKPATAAAGGVEAPSPGPPTPDSRSDIRAGQSHNGLGQRRFMIRIDTSIALRRARLSDDPAHATNAQAFGVHDAQVGSHDA